jgi:O-antigen/teichoic acid export membrane protein
MSLERNLVSNYLGQAYTAVIGLVMLPVYVRYMGAEAYGLVGFFTMLLAWLQLLDLGLTPTLSRELSRVRAGIGTERQTALMLRSTEWLFGGIGVLTATAIVILAGSIAEHWLKADRLTTAEIHRCVVCMGGVVASRWLVGLYRGGLAGLENLVSLNIAGAVIASVRSIGVVVVFLVWTTRPSGFFSYQLAVGLLELVVMRMLFYRAFPMTTVGRGPRMDSLRGLFAMAGSMAFLAGLWIVINQADKLVLSWTVDLHRYGYYMVAVMLAGGITLLAAPMAPALQPRFTVLAAQGDHARLTRLYRTTTEVTTAAVFAIAGVMACFAEPLLRAWTGNLEAARQSAPILPLYALGNAVAAVLALAFLLQFAYGKLRWHVIGNCLFAVVWFPGVLWAARRAGITGVAWVWLGANVAYLLGWVPYVHSRLVPGLWWRWLVYDVGIVALAEVLALALVSRIDMGAWSRPMVFAGLVVGTFGVALAGLAAGTESRGAILRACGLRLVAR